MTASISCTRMFNCCSKISLPCSRLHQHTLTSRHFMRRSLHSYNECSNIFGFSKITDSKNFSKEAARSVAKDKETNGISLSYQQMLCFRKRQAQKSVLIQVDNREDVSYAATACEKFGAINNVFTYSGQSRNVFLLLEFSEESSIAKLFSECRNENNADVFSISSRILNYNKKLFHDLPKDFLFVDSNDVHSIVLEKTKPNQVSEIIEDLYSAEKLSELSTRIRFFFCELLTNSVSGLFPHCEVFPFGSSVNGIGQQGCDLDIVMRLYPSPNKKNPSSEFFFLNKTCFGRIQDLQRRSVHAFGTYFRTFLPGLFTVKEILNARVPILKLEHRLLEVDCDISFNQMSAVLMSEMLYFCGEVDDRVRPLLFAVKKWARDSSITYQYPGSWITNFGLSLLVVFFLQNRPSPILPCFNEAMEIVGYEGSTEFKIDYLMELPNLQAKASLNAESLAVLLREFLAYLASNPFEEQHISVLSGKASKKRTEANYPIWIQYPLEEDKNVTKNVSHSELKEMCEKARLSSKYFDVRGGDLSSVLGVPFILEKFRHKSIKS